MRDLDATVVMSAYNLEFILVIGKSTALAHFGYYSTGTGVALVRCGPYSNRGLQERMSLLPFAMMNWRSPLTLPVAKTKTKWSKR